MGMYDSYIQGVINKKDPELKAKLSKLGEQYWENKISKEEYDRLTKEAIKGRGKNVPKKKDKGGKLLGLLDEMREEGPDVQDAEKEVEEVILPQKEERKKS